MPVNHSPKLKNPTKVRKIQDTSFDDSLSSNMSTSPNAETIIPPLVDPNNIPAALAAIMQQLNNLTSQVGNLDKKFDSIDGTLSNHTQEILELKQASYNTDSDVQQLKGRINVLEQREFDQDLIIGGYSALPGTNEVSALCVHYSFDPGNISHHFGFKRQQKNNTSQQKFNLVLSFSTKTAQLSFRSAVKEKGKATADPMNGAATVGAGNRRQSSNGALITVSNRYSYCFRNINWKLGLLKDEGKIHAIKYRNCCMHLQETENSKLIPVSTVEWLDCFMERINYKMH